MMRVVLNVNVLVSGFTVKTGVPAELLRRWLEREFEVVVSEPMLDEAAEAWRKDYFRQWHGRNVSRRATTMLRKRGIMVSPSPLIEGIAEDMEDDLVLDTAVAGRVSYLVTGDLAFAALRQFGFVVIIPPRSFLDILVASQSL